MEDQLSDQSLITKMSSEIISTLNCPVCLQMCDPPLMSCYNGHFTCLQCISKLSGDTLRRKSCPQCRETGFIRNLPYEKMAKELLAETELKCPHSGDDTYGCHSIYKFGELTDHLKTCSGLIQKYNCPCLKCTEHNLYSLPELINHMIINLGFNTYEEYRLNFIPSEAVGPLDGPIGRELAKLEVSEFGRNLGLRLNAHESGCSYSKSVIINYELKSDAHEDYNSIIIYPPYNFFNNFKKEDNLLGTDNSSGPDRTSTNFTFLIDTNQIYLVRSTCSITSNMVFCDGTYLNTQYMDESDPHRVFGLSIQYNYNHNYTPDEEPSIETSDNTYYIDEPPAKKNHRNTFKKIKYFGCTYINFEKYKSEMSEEVVNGINVEKGINTSKKDTIRQIQWCLVF